VYDNDARMLAGPSYLATAAVAALVSITTLPWVGMVGVDIARLDAGTAAPGWLALTLGLVVVAAALVPLLPWRAACWPVAALGCAAVCALLGSQQGVRVFGRVHGPGSARSRPWPPRYVVRGPSSLDGLQDAGA
jgi:hypothetical protein